ncbi:MAG: VWA domain-containing protein [Salinivirgaceae bacterium]|nr:VWA domain-containing protein [Salinivirgaceae bacterium]
MRRLPVYLLLDVSGSMRGEPIAAVNAGVKALVEALRTDPYALETAFLSIIPFNNTVEQSVPLTELYKIKPPELEAKQGTYLGKALKFLSATAEREVVKSSKEKKGDWKPIVFIMTDGKSGDKIAKALTDFNKSLFSQIVVCAYGNEANIVDLKLITENVIRLDNIDGETIKSFFKWVSASISTSSHSANDNHGDEQPISDLPPLPSSFSFVI